MYTCLFKKITVHNSEKVTRFSSNRVNQCIGIGGDAGFVKIVKFDLLSNKPDQTGKINPLIFSQSLTEHKCKIINLAWNDEYEKLTTSDEKGVIVVWKMQDDKWVVEMVNDRGASFVTDIKWNKQGQKLCFM
jgi:WD repeat-containing protein 35